MRAFEGFESLEEEAKQAIANAGKSDSVARETLRSVRSFARCFRPDRQQRRELYALMLRNLIELLKGKVAAQ